MDRFSLDELLRNAYSGATFLATIVFAYPTVKNIVPPTPDASALVTISLGAVLLSGTLIYVIHRALIYPFFYSLGLMLVWGHRRPSMIEIDLDRFARRSDDRSVQRHLVEWGSQVHFLYCTAWSIFAGLCVGAIAGWEVSREAVHYALGFAGFVFVAAAVHHMRLLVYDKKVADRDGPTQDRAAHTTNTPDTTKRAANNSPANQ